MVKKAKKKSYRYERKYLIKNSNLKKFYPLFIKSNFIRHHKERKIISIYFDNLDFTSVQENINGLFSRYKIRIRTYNEQDTLASAVIEIKSKSGMLGQKISIKIPEQFHNYSFNDAKTLNDLGEFITQEAHNILGINIGLVFPCLKISYDREYYIHSANDIRLTKDSGIIYENLINCFISQDSSQIVEVKYDFNVSFMRSLNSFLPIYTKNSKYVQGIKSTMMNM